MDTSQDPIDRDGQPAEEMEEQEGPRMTRLRGILDKSLEETLKACNYNAIRESFPFVAAANSGELHNAHEKVCLFLRGEVNVRLDNRRLGSALSQSRATQADIKRDLLDSYSEFQEATNIASQMPVDDMEQLIEATLRHVPDS
ncbi:hypothetical protein BGZ75_005867 [Mortierella antarctica]|nr:hypothetical protein BGZ75_005867 [Mortierella antarctica]